ncbi:MAG: hypothetical protein IPK68_13990 [Bdellovibrionales bacterium]|nr:hypothetical protein [Bdellovibrionales bacterium]
MKYGDLSKASRFAVNLIFVAFSGFIFTSCTPPDKPFESKESKGHRVTPLSVPENSISGYSYFLIGRLMQARFLLESAIQREADPSKVASESALSAVELMGVVRCRPQKILSSLKPDQDVYYWKYSDCKGSDGRVEALVSGEGRFVRKIQNDILDSLSFRSQGLKVNLRPRKGIQTVLGKRAEIDEEVELHVDRLRTKEVPDDNGVIHREQIYSFYFQSAPESRVFQDLVMEDRSARENLTEGFQIFGIFVVREGRVISFSEGELRLEIKGSRSLSFRDRDKNSFSKFNRMNLVLRSYSGGSVEISGSCSNPIGKLKQIKFEGPDEMGDPAKNSREGGREGVREKGDENKVSERSLVLEEQGLIDSESGVRIPWSDCLTSIGGIDGGAGGLIPPYGYVYLR